MSLNHLRFDRKFIRELWSLLKPYWVSEDKRWAWILLGLNTLCIIAEIAANIGYNQFHRDFYNALQTFNRSGLINAFYFLLLNITLLTISMGSSIYFLGILSVRWRRWLTTYYLNQWFLHHQETASLLKLKNIDNPDQRISEDIAQFTDKTLSLIFGPFKLLHSVLMLISFGYVLWGLSKMLTMGHTHFTIPGLLLWVALLYAVLGTWLMGIFGKKLSYFDYQQQHYNANFRYGLMKLREKKPLDPADKPREDIAEHLSNSSIFCSDVEYFSKSSIARNDVNDYQNLHQSFKPIVKNTIEIVSLKTRLAFFSKGYDFLSYPIGLLIPIPFYMMNIITLGTVMQTSSAYNSVVSGFSTFIDLFNDLAEWRSVIYRLNELNDALALYSKNNPDLNYQAELS